MPCLPQAGWGQVVVQVKATHMSIKG